MEEWKHIPKDIILWGKNFDIAMFVDENNTDTLKHIDKKLKNKQKIDKTEKYFTLTGCFIDKKNYVKLKDEFEFIKFKYWNDAEFYYKNKDEKCKVCFHSREIRMRQNAFNMPDKPYKNFLEDLTGVIQNIKFRVITVNIDLEKLIKKKKEVVIYEYAFEKLIRKFYESLKGNQKGIIIMEARGKKEDRNLHKYAVNLIEDLYEHKIKGIYFNSKWNKNNSVTYSGLELADLCTYPIHKNVRDERQDFAFKAFRNKIVAYEENGKIKRFP